MNEVPEKIRLTVKLNVCIAMLKKYFLYSRHTEAIRLELGCFCFKYWGSQEQVLSAMTVK